jgi:hypothetical protein
MYRAGYLNMLQGMVGSTTFEIQARKNLGLSS